MSEDSELLRRFAANDTGSESAFAEFVARRIGFVYGAALRQTSGAGQAHLAEEITQAVFLLASKKAAALARHGSVAGWLYSTTTFTARRMLRDASLRRVREQQAAAMNELLYNTNTNPTQPRPADHALMRETLDEALGLLGEKDRELVLLRFFDGREFAKIGALMNIPGNTARMRVSRALDKMRALYARRGVASTAAALGALMAAEAATAAPAGLAGSVSGAILAGGGGAAAAAATATTTASVLAFMTSTKIAITATVAALVVATVATVEVRREKTADDALAALKREHTALVKKLGNTQIEAKGVQTKLANFRRQKAEAVEYAKNPHDSVAAGEAFIAQHPEIQAMLVELLKADYENKSYLLFKRLNLTPDQIDRFEYLFFRSPAMGSNLLDKDIPGIGKITLSMTPPDSIPRQRIMDELKAMLGQAAYAKIMTSPSGHVESLSQQLGESLYYTDAPLSAEQVAQFQQLFYTQFSAKYPTRESWDGYSYPWDAILKQAGAFLSAPQMAALKQVRDNSDAGWAYYRLLVKERQAVAAEADKQPAANTGAGTEASQ